MKSIVEELQQPITPAFMVAVILHAGLLLAVGFSIELPDHPLKTVAVTFALKPSMIAPEKARHVAADDQLGTEEAGDQDTQTRLVMQTSLTVSQELYASDGDIPSNVATNRPLEKQIKELQEHLSSLSDSHHSNSSRVGAVAARRSLDANYLVRWRGRVEQVGNALYRGEPPAGDGDVRLLVTVLADGTLENIRILESSGNSELDRAAQDTVVLAAPFPRFSTALAQRTPRLEIVRTWQFRTQPVSSE